MNFLLLLKEEMRMAPQFECGPVCGGLLDADTRMHGNHGLFPADLAARAAGNTPRRLYPTAGDDIIDRKAVE